MTGTQESFELAHEADVGAIRRRLTTLATDAGLDETATGQAALIATELGTNVVKHAGVGGALIGRVTVGERPGVAIVVWDRGRGMNLEACLTDGMSTTGTAGGGLGAVA
ncbi:MAG: ATP-binding protein, partial [Deltaproteobacteria bacterium]|nr:ATP-binding protein [Deltaproteobacteria bacterium]